ncbi:acyltransferase family protein [Microbacterium trichothecenolyticum]|uniref:Acyltransferase family protein n=1 Tax=Microbacterium trichothecenolyticum TaxID=69370 RepID=A0A0M2H474_MICTR|nr:acyltransferase [Microbacterium trichothecenolyticum]KJL41242.1 Acyltransferase family protein [Microbacterium trichothecenolyticum]
MRTRELDSLRGLAAVSVLFYHVVALNSPALQDGVYLKEAANPIANLLIFSPLHIAWLGLEAVWLFFVLSAFVLTKAATRPDFSWGAYYPSRLVRLYGPVLVAIAFAALTYLVIPHVVEPGDSPVLATLPTSYAINDILRDATLFGGTSTAVGVLWSLQWEVIFSLTLPVYVLMVRRFPRSATVIAVAGCLIGWIFTDPVLSFMPLFFFGALLAQYWNQVCEAFGFLATRRWTAHVAGSALLVLTVLGLTSYFTVGPWLQQLDLSARVMTLPLVVAAIVLLIIIGVNWPPLSRFLTLRPMLFLGTISFSLYLVHRPIMIALAFVFGVGAVPAVIEIAVSIAVAVGFAFAVERPLHRLSQRVARAMRTLDRENFVTAA